MEAEGHVVAHHTFDHLSIADQVKRNAGGGLTKATRDFFAHQIDDAIAVASPYLPLKGLRPYLRPPFLDLDDAAATYLGEEYDMYVVQINLDTKDYEAGATMASIRDAFNGNIYDDSTEHSWVALQHDQYPASTAAIPQIINYGKSSGYRFVGIDECMGFPAEQVKSCLIFVGLV
jgi:peptidoglycan/xylan/chitin deacetylase (PgdA/CDA1 family)